MTADVLHCDSQPSSAVNPQTKSQQRTNIQITILPINSPRAVTAHKALPSQQQKRNSLTEPNLKSSHNLFTNLLATHSNSRLRTSFQPHRQRLKPRDSCSVPSGPAGHHSKPSDLLRHHADAKCGGEIFHFPSPRSRSCFIV